MSNLLLPKDEPIEAAGWAADAGKLHAVKTLFESVSFGSQDFTYWPPKTG